MFAASAVVGRQVARQVGRRAIHTGKPAFGGADEPVRERDVDEDEDARTEGGGAERSSTSRVSFDASSTRRRRGDTSEKRLERRETMFTSHSRD
jgi:hypothetical protein